MVDWRNLTDNSALRAVSLVLAILWMGMIYYLSAQPAIATLMTFPGEDKLFHAAVYGLLGILFLGAFRQGGRGYRRPILVLAILLAVLYGITDEWHQSYVPGRTPDITDVIADGIGATIGVFLANWILVRLRSRPVEEGFSQR